MVSRPTMICVLKENTKGLTIMNKKQMWIIIEEKGLTDKAFEIEKNRERKPCMRSMEVIDLKTGEKLFFSKDMWGGEILWKMLFFFHIQQQQSVGK